MMCTDGRSSECAKKAREDGSVHYPNSLGSPGPSTTIGRGCIYQQKAEKKVLVCDVRA